MYIPQLYMNKIESQITSYLPTYQADGHRFSLYRKATKTDKILFGHSWSLSDPLKVKISFPKVYILNSPLPKCTMARWLEIGWNLL